MTSVSPSSYVIISPVRNEGANLEKTIQGVISQTIRPTEWIIVDDGSTDGTGAIVDQAASVNSWIRAIHRPDRGHRSQGTGVIEAFYDGLTALGPMQWEFLVKLDGDIVVAPTYFEKCFEQFAADQSLGIGGGTVTHLDEGTPKIEAHPKFHVRGATKIYRRQCWNELGGLLRSPGWDTLDELKAQYLGWTTRTFFDLQVLHLRHTGAADGAWHNAVKNGLANYVTAYHPLFMLLKCVKRMKSKPYGVQTAGLSWGFISGYLRKVPRVSDPGLVRYIRRQQLRRLAFRSSIWE